MAGGSPAVFTRSSWWATGQGTSEADPAVEASWARQPQVASHTVTAHSPGSPRCLWSGPTMGRGSLLSLCPHSVQKPGPCRDPPIAPTHSDLTQPRAELQTRVLAPDPTACPHVSTQLPSPICCRLLVPFLFLQTCPLCCKGSFPAPCRAGWLFLSLQGLGPLETPPKHRVPLEHSSCYYPLIILPSIGLMVVGSLREGSWLSSSHSQRPGQHPGTQVGPTNH